MTNLKSFVVACLATLIALPMMADGPKKPVLLVETFKGSSDFSKADIESARNSVIAKANEGGRAVIVDNSKSTANAVAAEIERRKQESAMNDDREVGDISTLKADYILTGNLDDITVKSSTDKEGKVSYSAELRFSLTITNPADGSVLSQKQFKTSGYGSSSEEAHDKAVADVSCRAVKNFFINAFKVDGQIIKIEDNDAKKAKSVYINLGEADGIKAGQSLEVFREIDLDGEISRKLIGQVKVKEVMGQTRCLATVSKGGEEILKYITAGEKLPVQTKYVKTITLPF